MTQSSFDLQSVRSDFPTLGGDLRYCDSAASSLTPRPVLAAMEGYYMRYRANVHRGLYAESGIATDAFEDARVTVAGFIDAIPEEVSFTGGATASANMIVRMLEENMKFAAGDEIVLSIMEHHAILVPLQRLARRTGLVLRYIPLAGTGLDLDAARNLIGPRTRIVSILHASNVLGRINDVATIAALGKAAGAFVITDLTASAGHLPLSVRALGADAAFFSGHKMLGPTGVGVMWLDASHEDMEPGYWGGGMVERVSEGDATWTSAPGRFEAGTPPIAEAIGLAEAVRYLDGHGLDAIHGHVRALLQEAIRSLGQIPGVRILSERDPEKNVGTIAFALDGVHPHDLGQILADHRVAVRAGHHCAMPLHRALGVPATTRASFHCYNSFEDVEALCDGVEAARKMFSQ
jgi:cysteine desulfurase/selenocysteine lyase